MKHWLRIEVDGPALAFDTNAPLPVVLTLLEMAKRQVLENAMSAPRDGSPPAPTDSAAPVPTFRVRRVGGTLA